MKTRKEVGTSLGFIVHDFEGLLLAITSMLIQFVLEPREAEAFAFQWSIIKAAKLLLSNACYDQLSVFHGIVEDSRRFLAISLRKELLFTKRLGNQAAHCLASLAFTFHYVSWIEEVSFQLDQIIAYDVSYLNFHHQ